MIRSGLNIIIILGAKLTQDNALRRLVDHAAWGCVLSECADAAVLVAASASQEPPALAIVEPGAGAAEWLARLRAQPGLWSTTPVLALGAPGEDELAVNGWITPEATDAEVLAAVERWTGPLGRPELRDPEDPRYRLVRLIGMDRAADMLARFAGKLETALAMLEPPVDRAGLPALAHGIAGMAGLYGFSELGELWLAVERGESRGVAAVEAATRLSLDALRDWPGPVS